MKAADVVNVVLVTMLTIFAIYMIVENPVILRGFKLKLPGRSGVAARAMAPAAGTGDQSGWLAPWALRYNTPLPGFQQPATTPFLIDQQTYNGGPNL